MLKSRPHFLPAAAPLLRCVWTNPETKMTRSQFAILLTLCAAMSLTGSFGAVYLLQGETVEAQAKDPELLRARRFELVDGKGKVRASLGLDTKGNTELVLRAAGYKARIRGGVAAEMATPLIGSAVWKKLFGWRSETPGLIGVADIPINLPPLKGLGFGTASR